MRKSSGKIKDFGKKIGGAKKDLWAGRNLEVEDLFMMDEIDRNEFVKKENIWPLPDYVKMKQKGIPVSVIYFIKSIRDSLPVSSADSAVEVQERYVSFISDIRDRTMNISSENEINNYLNDVIGSYGKLKYSYFYPDTGYAKLITNCLLKVANSSYDKRMAQVRKRKFLYSDEEKLLADYQIFKFDDKTNFLDDITGHDVISIELNRFSHIFVHCEDELFNKENWEKDKWFIVKNQKVVNNNLNSYDEAKQYILDNFELDKKKKPSHKKMPIPYLKELKRTGPSYFGTHVKTQDMLDVFDFHGGEFGNWENDNERQENLDLSYNAFSDLARALDVSSNDISFNGTLSIAYGSRGSGRAKAHYEPLRKVINLTKKKGAGSLAHEWGHALDHYIGEKLLGVETSIIESNDKLVLELIKTMKYKPMDKKEFNIKTQNELDSYRDSLKDFLNNKMKKCYENKPDRSNEFDKIIDEFLDKDVSENDYFKAFCKGFSGMKREFPDFVEQLSKLICDTTGRVLHVYDKEIIVSKMHIMTKKREQIKDPEMTVNIETDFYKNAKILDSQYHKSKPYWSTEIEMFARCFACYIKDKLEEKGERCDYLCGDADMYKNVPENTKDKPVVANPYGREREEINKQIDVLMEKVKEMGLLHEYNEKDFIIEEPTKIMESNERINIPEMLHDSYQMDIFDFLDDREI